MAMTVGELVRELNRYDENLEVDIGIYGYLNMKIKEVSPDSHKTKDSDFCECIVLSTAGPLAIDDL